MRFLHYIKDRISLLVWCALSMIILALFLIAAGNSFDTVCVVLFIESMTIVIYICISFVRRYRYLNSLLQLSDSLEEKYLISEVMEKPLHAEDEVFYGLLKKADKSMLEKIAEIREEKKEYREYIEQWVHEAKTPITAMQLMCQNHKDRIPKGFMLELEKLNHYVEQTLYFARSEETYKDYLVREIKLEDVVHQAILENRQLLMQNEVQIEVQASELTAYTDEKWIVFILNQLFQNAVKYKKDRLIIKIEIQQQEDKTVISVIDNGLGISKEDLPRIFEKGFTGQNGRKGKRATGMGLYLCKRLCERLQVGIDACSDGINGTTFRLIFYRNRLMEIR